MKLIDGIPIWGTPDEGAVSQIKTCAKTVDSVALMADHLKPPCHISTPHICPPLEDTWA